MHVWAYMWKSEIDRGKFFYHSTLSLETISLTKLGTDKFVKVGWQASLGASSASDSTGICRHAHLFMWAQESLNLGPVVVQQVL